MCNSLNKPKYWGYKFYLFTTHGPNIRFANAHPVHPAPNPLYVWCCCQSYNAIDFLQTLIWSTTLFFKFNGFNNCLTLEKEKERVTLCIPNQNFCCFELNLHHYDCSLQGYIILCMKVIKVCVYSTLEYLIQIAEILDLIYEKVTLIPIITVLLGINTDTWRPYIIVIYFSFQKSSIRVIYIFFFKTQSYYFLQLWPIQGPTKISLVSY